MRRAMLPAAADSAMRLSLFSAMDSAQYRLDEPNYSF